MTAWTRRVSRLWILGLAAACALTACAVTPPLRTPEEQVSARALARWRALMAGDFKAAYEYGSPASRSAVSFERFRSGFGAAANWKGAEVDSVRCEPLRCVVLIKLAYEPLMLRQRLGVLESRFEEVWLLDDGQWWLPLKQGH